VYNGQSTGTDIILSDGDARAIMNRVVASLTASAMGGATFTYTMVPTVITLTAAVTLCSEDVDLIATDAAATLKAQSGWVADQWNHQLFLLPYCAGFAWLGLAYQPGNTAFIANPRVLILDEATASLDIPSERLIQHGLKTLLAGRTAIIIAHRLSTVAIADRVLVMDGGRIIEDGPTAELLKGTGRFATLHRAWLDSLA
jgi:hypothetical protein